MKRDQRLRAARGSFPGRRLDGLLVTNPENLYFLSGFSGTDGRLLLTRRRAYLITDSRFLEEARREVTPDFEVVLQERSLPKTLSGLVSRLRLRRVGFEEDNLTYADYRRIKAALAGKSLVPSGSPIERLRLIKETEEIKLLRESAGLADKFMARLAAGLHTGITEKEVAGRLLNGLQNSGLRPAFEPIVAFGPRSSQPHAVPSDRRLKPGNIILIDMGVRLKRYHSDLTRTYAWERFPPRFQKIYRLVEEAQARAMRAIAPGVKASLIDAQARDYLRERGWGDYFSHSLGHGVGLEIHELPRVDSRSPEVLREGMVFTVEPGLYLPGWGGIRIEDMVEVTADGYQRLTHSPAGLASALLPRVVN